MALRLGIIQDDSGRRDRGRGAKGGAAGGTIVRQLPVSVSGGVPAIITASPSGASHLKVTAKSLEELREKKLELLLEISKELSKQQELDRLLDKVVEFTFQVMNVDRVSILLLEERSEEHTSELQSRLHLVCRLLLEKKNTIIQVMTGNKALPSPSPAETAGAFIYLSAES